MIITATDRPCKVCGRPMARYERERYGKPDPYWVCNYQSCKRVRFEANQDKRRAKRIPDSHNPVQIPVCDCGARKTLQRYSDLRPSYWYCPECRRKRNLAAKRDRIEGTGTGPCWRDIKEYWRVERRWNLDPRRPTQSGATGNTERPTEP
jgi:hypothetical protein